MEERKLSNVLNANPELILIINDWINTDVETLLMNGVIKPEEIPKKREELFERYLDLVYSLLWLVFGFMRLYMVDVLWWEWWRNT